MKMQIKLLHPIIDNLHLVISHQPISPQHNSQ